MNQSENQNEANLGRLLFDERSPMSLHVCLKPIDGDVDAMASLDPFEVISLGVGKRYILARLSVGRGFMDQFVLLNIHNPKTDLKAVDELALLESVLDDQRIPLPSVIDFNNSGKGYSPAFYCTKQQYFFHVPCPICSGTLELKSKCDFLYCSRCEELNQKSGLYSFYEAPDHKNVTLLEDIFAQYANAESLPENVPCNGCPQASNCFPIVAQNEKEASNVVANESHYIIPFSIERFSVYGFSYYPLTLIDYCELISGKPKDDLLETLKKTKETGRYRVLIESESFSHKLRKQQYLTVESPDLMWVLSIKLRVFMRICDSLSTLSSRSGQIDVSGISHNGMCMDVSQSHSAGDSFTRARLVFLCLGKTAGIVEGEKSNSDEIPVLLSDILFFIFFRNKNSNELALRVAIDLLIDEVNSARELSLDGLNAIISSSNELKIAFDSNSLLYQAKTPQPNDVNVSNMTLGIIRLGLILSKRIDKNIFSLSLDSLVSVINELKNLFSSVDLSRTNASASSQDKKQEQDILLTALNEIIDDEAWLNSFFPNDSSSIMSHTNEGANDANVDVSENMDKTVIMSEKQVDDKTVVLKSNLPDDVEADDVMIMSSINRILRQL